MVVMERRESSLALAVEQIGTTQPSSPALTDVCGVRSYAELSHLVASMRRVVEKGTNQGDLLGLQMDSRVECIAALLACESAGRTAVLLPPGLQAGEHHDATRNSGLRFMLEVRRGETDGDARLARVSGAGAPALPRGIVQLTSGSLGTSRLAVRAWSGIRNELESVSARLGLTQTDRVLCASSIAHSYGVIGGLLAPLLAGAQVTLSSPDVPGTVDRPTIIFGLARTYHSLLARTDLESVLSDVRFALSAGAPLPKGLFDSFLDRTGVPIRQDYGTTETGTISIDDAVPARPDTVGRPLQHVEVRIAHPGFPHKGSDGGEIQVRSAAVAVGYLTGRALVLCRDQDGWYHTRDTGSLGSSGFLTVGGRLRPPVKVADGEATLDEIEAAISGIPGVREVVVVPVVRTDETRLKAIVATDLNAETLANQCATVLPSGHRPDEFKIVDALPRSPAGKVLQKYLM